MNKISRLMALVTVGFARVAVGCDGLEPETIETIETVGIGIEQIADGEWEVEMAQEGKTWVARFRVNGGKLECSASGLETMVGMRGRAMLIGNGVFMVQVRNSSHAATQFWVFQEDGTAIVKEVPDRGEKQRARLLVSERPVDG